MSDLPELWLIAALSRNRVIGLGGDLPWHVPEDLKLFKRTTRGAILLMGRKTWESIGSRPLKKRRNLVLSRDADFCAPGAEVVHSLEQARQLCQGEEAIFVAGGGQLYAQALPLASRLYLSWIDIRIEGDVVFPEFDSTQWQERERRHYEASSEAQPAFDFSLLFRV